MSGKVSMATVAGLAGVSTATVSRVINDHPNIAEATRRRTLAAIQELGYEPDRQVQRVLRSVRGSCDAVAFLVDPTMIGQAQLPGAFYWRIQWAVQRALQAADKHMLLADSEHDILPDGQLKACARGLADGIIAKVNDGTIVKRLSARTPVVLFYSDHRLPCVDVVLPDAARAIRDQMAYLVALGHRRIAMFRPNPDVIWQDREIWWHYEAACKELGCELSPLFLKPIHFTCYQHAQAISEWLDLVLPSASPPTAVLTFDTYAAEMIRQLQNRGLRVPADISIVGYDDDPISDPSPVPVTTFRQNFELMASTAVELLEARRNEPERSSRVVLIEGDLIEKGSAAPAPANNTRRQR